ncbi:MAG: SsrA-binding protein SmpB [Bacilli bacterium]|nr:SsrA-binding protein SmpB [Bacilli bacterium]
MEIINRKARFDYELLDKYEAGIVLTGTEIKSIRNGNVNLKDSYAVIKNGEIYLLNMHISEYKEGNIFNHDESRTRKLLLHKNEIKKISDKVSIKGLTIVPLKLYFSNGKAKIELAVARGKHTYDKKETIKQRDLDREMKKSLSGKY